MNSSGLQPLAREIFEGLSGSYDRVLEFGTLMQDRYWKARMVREAHLLEGMEVLDVGCGTGVLESSLNSMRVSVVGVDLTEGMVRRAQLKRLECLEALTVGDGEHLPFRDSAFDVVLSCYVVKYSKPRVLASEFMRVLRPEGRMVLYDFTSPRGPLAPLHAFYAYGLLRILGSALGRIGFHQAFTLKVLPSVIRQRNWDDSFADVLSACGFSEVRERRLSGGVVTAFWGRKP